MERSVVHGGGHFQGGEVGAAQVGVRRDRDVEGGYGVLEGDEFRARREYGVQRGCGSEEKQVF